MNTRLGTAIEALQKIRDVQPPAEMRFRDTWHSAYARQLAADTLDRIEHREVLDEQMRSVFVQRSAVG